MIGRFSSLDSAPGCESKQRSKALSVQPTAAKISSVDEGHVKMELWGFLDPRPCTSSPARSGAARKLARSPPKKRNPIASLRNRVSGLRWVWRSLFRRPLEELVDLVNRSRSSNPAVQAG